MKTLTDPQNPTDTSPPALLVDHPNPQREASQGLPGEPLAKPLPPAALIVAKATKTEREAALEQENEGLAKGLADQKAKTLEHEATIQGLKTLPTLPPAPPPLRKPRLFEGTTLEGLADDEDGD